ncbi:MAG TPA: helix-turn-helix transcriptional regulator [Gemmatimonadaceae bacterium]|nr:helix-turn-helix transcriptional regulator [Gemmatimonadaceae bacterium]
MTNLASSTRDALARRCSIGARKDFVDTTVFDTSRAAIGVFRCPATYPSFRDTGPIERSIVVFPRTGVWIRHAGSRAFLADPSVVTIYNASQEYERFAESPDGDRCDWFGVSADVAREIVRGLDPEAADSNRPFTFQRAPSSTTLYMRQRALLRRALRGELDALEGEEAVIGIVESAIGRAYADAPRSRARRRSSAVRHGDLADAARVELIRSVRETRSVSEIASALGTSAYHLCRVFRACTGRTMHEYRNELRVRTAMEHLENNATRANLSAVAHELGFSSHSHFVRAMRRYAGWTPSAVRAML